MAFMKRKLVTSALPYVNNIPHLGNLIQVLSADVFSRFCRLKGYETLYVCGTDEYGTATETKALEEGKTPRQLCDYYHSIHSDIYNWFEIAFDHFGRTSTPQQTEVTQGIFLDLDKNGYIKEHTIEQLFCTQCNRFLADRYVLGTCPACGYTDARGDQCEHCGKLLDPVELSTPRCSSCSSTPEVRSTKHLYIDLPGILPEYETWMKEASQTGQWAKNAIQMTQAWIRDGLQERAITRDLSWGIPVPKKGFEHKVFYVWFDAPIGYISITKCYFDRIGQTGWEKWWHDPENVELFQFIGKDNIPFHTVIFPSSLIGSGNAWTKLHHMSSTEYLNYESGKFSKSKGIGVFGSDAKESGIPADMWRFYIFYNRPEKSDAQFTWKDFQEKINSELIGNLGNLVNRTLTFIDRYYDGVIPGQDGRTSTRKDIVDISSTLFSSLENSCAKITQSLEWADLRDAFREIFALSSIANKAFQDGEPWKNRTQDPEKAEALLHDLVYLIKDITIMLHPFIPAFSDRVSSFLGKKVWSGTIFNESDVLQGKEPVARTAAPAADTLSWNDIGKREGLTKVYSPEIIFKPLDDALIDEYREKYSGSQKDRKEKENKMSEKENTVLPETQKEQVVSVSQSDIFNSKISLKTAKIIGIEKHPDAEKLYIETLDDGAGENRIILSGLVPYFTEEQLLGKSIIIADNLKPRKMRGIESRGMLLAASSKTEDGTEVLEVLDSSMAAPGTPVILEGSDSSVQKPESISADDFFAVQIVVVDGQVTIDGKRLMINDSPVRTTLVKNGEVS